MTTSNSKTPSPEQIFQQAKASMQPVPSNQIEPLFRQCLLENLSLGVIFVDREYRILNWSKPLEGMTGIASNQTTGRQFTSELLNLCDSDGNPFTGENDLVMLSLTSRRKISVDCKIVGRSGREVKVDMTVVPVVDADGILHGGIILFEDTTVQLDLQRQLKDLYKFSTLDPLTQVANRSEFERVLDDYVKLNQNSNFKCCLIICDIDFFKNINDNYNHHVGDQALISFANLLKRFVRAQDLVARYGGEEFVILCGNCDKASALERAEEIRQTLTQTPQPMLDGKCITASFGVAELNPGVTATDLFVQADTALLRAKELGRNRVIDAADELQDAEAELSRIASNFSGIQWRNLDGKILVSEDFHTSMPISVLVEKLRGFIVETHADILRVGTDHASLTCEFEDPENYARRGKFLVDVEFQEKEIGPDESAKFGQSSRSYIRITVREGKRKWFSSNCNELAPNLITEFRQFLMLTEESCRLSLEPQATKSVRD